MSAALSGKEHVLQASQWHLVVKHCCLRETPRSKAHARTIRLWLQAEWAQAVSEESRLLRAHQLRLETELQAAQAAMAAAAAAAAPAVADGAHARGADVRIAAKGSCAAACANAAAPAERSGAAAEAAVALAACAETNAGATADSSRRSATGDAAATSTAADATEASCRGTRGVPELGNFGAGGSVGGRAARVAGCAGGAPAPRGTGGWELAELRDSLAQHSGLTQVRACRASDGRNVRPGGEDHTAAQAHLRRCCGYPTLPLASIG